MSRPLSRPLLLITGLFFSPWTVQCLAVDVFASAAAGHPYGVATIDIPVEPPVVGRRLPPVLVSDADGRVMYPIADDLRVKIGAPRNPARRPILQRVGNLIRDLVGEEEELEQTVTRRVAFLIRGHEPIQVRLRDADGEIGVYELVPRVGDPNHAEMLERWWQSFTDAAQQQIENAKYPTVVESYLVAMLSGRTGMPLPDWYHAPAEEADDGVDTLKLIAGAGDVAESVFRQSAAGSFAREEANVAVPPPPQWAPLFSAEHLKEIPVEPIATRVPPECFYIRYGSFQNYLWFVDLTEEYGGDLSRMVMINGIRDNATERLENQLSMRMTELSRMLGGTVIEDQAIIGRDLFMGEGASMGALLKTKNAFLLRTSLATERAAVAKQEKSITLKNIKIGGRPVSLLSSPDHRVRSFMAEDDGYIFVANSRALIERFFEVGESKQSLASTSAFRLSRQLMPLERNDTIFAYFSPQMLRGLVSPHYMIELRRRLAAKSDITLVHMARLAAAAEGHSAQGVDELVEAGFLPEGFGRRPDRSGVLAVGETVIDSRRGARGTFLPIADAKVAAITPSESNWYAEIADHYSQRFPTLDPIMVGVQRSPELSADGVERIRVHAEIAPWDAEKYGWIAQQLGPPTRVALKFAPDDIIAVQAHVESAQLGPATHLFAGVKDTVPPQPEDFEGLLKIYRSLQQIPGYLGAWPRPGALDRLPLGLGVGTPVAPGMNRLIGGLYRYTGGGFSVLSFQPEVLNASLPFISAVDVEDSAQVRAHIGNLRGSQIEGWVNAQLYRLSESGSLAGANFLNLLTRQLKVEAAQALPASERILGTPLQCTLGGEYRYGQTNDQWASSGWGFDGQPPAGYQAPILKWFRGADATLTQYEDRVVADAVIDVQRAAGGEAAP